MPSSPTGFRRTSCEPVQSESVQRRPPRFPPIDDLYSVPVLQNGTSSIPFHVSASYLQVYPMLRLAFSSFPYSSCFVVLYFVLRSISLVVTLAQLLHFCPFITRHFSLFLSFCIYFPLMSSQSAPSFPFLQPSLSFGFAIRHSPALMHGQNGESFACQLGKYCPNAA